MISIEKIDSARGILRKAFEIFDDKVGLSCSFGKDSVTVLHLAREFHPEVPAIYINTGLDFPETRKFMEDLHEQWDLNLRVYHPTRENVRHRNELDLSLNLSDPDLCCDLLKVEPTERALSGLEAWIVGLRRDETEFRQDLEPFEIVERPDGLPMTRIAPIHDWTETEVWDYIKTNDVPYHPLYDSGYRSMGCMPCSKAGMRGRFERAGRWDGSDKEECGIHTFLPRRDFMPNVRKHEEGRGEIPGIVEDTGKSRQ
ncbi:MAG: phosphoadenylyl-sulfate reductase [Thermoplasmata archaeon]